MMGRAMVVVVLREGQLGEARPARLCQRDAGKKGMRFRNFVARFQIAALVREGEKLTAAVGPDAWPKDEKMLIRRTLPC